MNQVWCDNIWQAGAFCIIFIHPRLDSPCRQIFRMIDNRRCYDRPWKCLRCGVSVNDWWHGSFWTAGMATVFPAAVRHWGGHGRYRFRGKQGWVGETFKFMLVHYVFGKIPVRLCGRSELLQLLTVDTCNDVARVIVSTRRSLCWLFSNRVAGTGGSYSLNASTFCQSVARQRLQGIRHRLGWDVGSWLCSCAVDGRIHKLQRTGCQLYSHSYTQLGLERY